MSKYENIKSVVETYIAVYEADLLEFYNDDHEEGDKVDAVFKYIREALRKAESMDRLIEARKLSGAGNEWFVWAENDVGYPPTIHAMNSKDTHHCPIDEMPSAQNFAILAANETAKFIED